MAFSLSIIGCIFKSLKKLYFKQQEAKIIHTLIFTKIYLTAGKLSLWTFTLLSCRINSPKALTFQKHREQIILCIRISHFILLCFVFFGSSGLSFRTKGNRCGNSGLRTDPLYRKNFNLRGARKFPTLPKYHLSISTVRDRVL